MCIFSRINNLILDLTESEIRAFVNLEIKQLSLSYADNGLI